MSYNLMNSRPSFYPSPVNLNSYMGNCIYKLKVEGKGSIMVQPDTAVVTIGVTTENTQLKAAQEESAQKVNEILKTLRRLGIPPEDITTQSYSIDPQYDYVDGKQVFRGYRVTHNLKVTIRDIDKTGEVIDQAVASGANVVNNISFTVSDPSKYYQQALTAAIDDASAKARTVGVKLKVEVYPIPVQIIEEGYEYSTPVEATFIKAAESATPIQKGQIEISARIEAVYVYMPH